MKMIRSSRFILPLLFLFSIAHTPASAQQPTSSPTNLEVGAMTQVVFMERAPRATGVGGVVSWWAAPRWGIRGEFRRDAGLQRSIQKAYSSTTEWGDDRRLNGTVALLWEAFRGDLGSTGHSLRLHAGPTVQRQRSERLRFLGATESETELLNTVQGTDADHVYLEENKSGPGTLVALSENVNRINWGASVGLKYGVHYGPSAFHFALTARKVTNVDGVTFGLGGELTFSL